ncbi:hypothetical protein M2323_004339 [Rhodoblastus acidophilus]|uniref:LssY C-terminal domain-containing protein n=1 Tax=Rhodoblastus acidophilus TaxID=1074 RepID=UPI002224EE55|nr:LssY C-terminal domain-containing protein [Rhodoblastus acidophilus]MCW2286542.1 hypothetical protein [Rhodoblastus acidophilus]MCW2335391.1 hypothetical protein [Rhodoblastus acidophilus]
MRRLILLLRRLLVVALGAVTVWLIAFVIFDFADQRLPVALAVACTYALAAYVVLPRAIRIGLRLLQRGRVPSYTLTSDGFPGDPVNLALIGTMRQLRTAFAAAGWSEADALNLASSWRMVRAFVLNQPYRAAPFSTLYLFGRRQDIGFQQPIGDSPRKRHHVRFWAISFNRAEQTLDTPSFWLDTLRPSDDERALWIGAATRDTGFSLTRLSFQITHATDADTNEERDFIVEALEKCGAIANFRLHRPSERFEIGRVNRYVTDGFVAVAELVSPENAGFTLDNPPCPP